MRKREKTEHAMRNSVQGLRTEVLLLLFAYLALYNKGNKVYEFTLFLFFFFSFFDVFMGFSGIFWANFLVEPRA